jgi:hypothetical protein
MLRSQRSADQARSRPQRAARPTKQAYDEALLAEWIMISSYSPEDFHCRFGWPEMSLEAGRHFARSVA